MPFGRVLLFTLPIALALIPSTFGCGAKTELYEPTPLTEEEICDATENAEWVSGDCGGSFDRCGLLACENVNGDGCDCLAPEQCWNGHACVAR